MDILSFILGMSVVVVIAVALVAVMAFVKVKKHNKEIETIHTIMGNEIERSDRNREEAIQNVYRTLDSRLDKHESKVKNNFNELTDKMIGLNEKVYFEMASLFKNNNLK